MISIDPLLPDWMIASLLAAAVVLMSVAAIARSRGSLFRLLLIVAIAIALLHPIRRNEQRVPQADTALILVDNSSSMALDDRGSKANALAKILTNTKLKNLDWRQASIPVSPKIPQRTDGFTALQQSLAQMPRGNLAGTILITDGLFHDQPQLDKLKALGKPIHVVIVGNPKMVDRRIIVLASPPFAIVGSQAHPMVKVDDGSAGHPVTITWQLNGVDQAPVDAMTGTPVALNVPITRRGATEIIVAVEPLAGERVTSNNKTLFTINGVRDRLNVLLVTGAPYPGARLWRDTLKSDPAIDLIHFTILRLPKSVDAARNDELSLIPFPVNQLFEERLGSFDLVIFDRYSALDLLQPEYFDRLSQYVKNGGALLVVAGPEYDSPQSLATTGLSAVLPALPSDTAPVASFTPEITELGLRHPIVATLQRPWGPWFRFTRSRAVAGQTLLRAGASPLLQVNDYGHGRVAMLMSDQLWLWARGDQPGPWDDLVRRTAHWLMKEPELEAEQLGLSVVANTLVAERRSLDAKISAPMVFTSPNGVQSTRQPTATATSVTASVPLAGPGIYAVRQGKLSASLDVDADAPEFADIRPTDQVLKSAVEATGGGISFGVVPELKRVHVGDATSADGWFGLVNNNAGKLVGVQEAPLLPPWLGLVIIGGLAMLAWWREHG